MTDTVVNENIVECHIDAPLRLWCVDLSLRPSPAEIAWLSPRERARAARFHFDRDRAHYLSAHVALRRLVAQSTGIACARQRYVVGPAGKVHLDPAHVHVNASYAGDVALIGIADDAEIGVDVERLRTIEDATELALLHFDEAEQAALVASEPRAAAFLTGWCRKEACLKAMGTGLQFPTRDLHTGLIERTVDVDAGGVTIAVGSVRPAPGLVAAWAKMRPAIQ